MLYKILLCLSFGASYSHASLPTVDAAFFKPGRSWTWDYYRNQKIRHSTERYTVIEAHGDEVLIEMSTEFPGQGVYNSHHRLLVKVSKCLAAYRNPAQSEPWSFRMFYRSQKGWEEIVPPTTLAFEEKFNCNPHRYDSREFLTVFRDTQKNHLFQHKRWRRMEGTWFVADGEQAAVAFEKSFNHGVGSQNYVLKLRP